MCAKICHDISAPASAVTMGLEMLTQTPQDHSIYEILNYSAQSTTSKLEVFRCLTSFSSMPNKPTGPDIEKALKNYWPDKKIHVTWQSSKLDNLQGQPARLLLAVLLTAADGLPKGGTLTVETPSRIFAEGPTAYLQEEKRQALTGQTLISQQTVHTVIAFFAHTLAYSLKKKLQINVMGEKLFYIEIQ